MFRGSITAAAITAAALAPAAHAGPRIDFKQVFTTTVPGASTGVDTQIVYKHPDDPNGKPIPLRREIFTYPEGTQFDNAVVPPCEASEMQLQVQGESACPPESRVLNGQGTTMTGFGSDETPIEVAGFDDGSGLLLLGADKQFDVRSATPARRNGRVVTVEVPKTPGGPPDGEGSLRRVHNVLDPHTLRERAYTRTPAVCPRSGHWTLRARFLFADGYEEEAESTSPCTRDTTRPIVRVAGVPRPRCIAFPFRVRVTVKDASPLAQVRVRLDGKLLRTTTAPAFFQRVRARRLRAGRHRLTVAARDVAGNSGRRSVRFRRC